MRAVIDKKVYDTKASTLLASDVLHRDWKDIHGRKHFLYQTKNGRYFQYFYSNVGSEPCRITPYTVEDAVALFEALPTKYVEFEKAFPQIEVEEA